MRGRAWRRYKKECRIKKRIHFFNNTSRWWRGLEDVNHNHHQRPLIGDFINTEVYFHAKTISTDYHATRNKVKYSPNRSPQWWRDSNKKGGFREKTKREFRKRLKEDGLI
jgi:hypothetical protein